MKNRLAWFNILVMTVIVTGCATQQQLGSSRPGLACEHSPDWYYFEWLARAPYAPTFDVLDTESSLGPYAAQTKTITLKDLVKFHGHACDGLVTAACALAVGLKELYPDAVIDRTDTGGISNNSPCFGDVVAYLTGGRIRFGTHNIDSHLANEFILYRFSTGQAVKVSLKPGVFPAELTRLETTIRRGTFTLHDMRRCQQLQWAYARMLLSQPLTNWFVVEKLPEFVWEPDAYPNRGARGDVLLKNVLQNSPYKN